MTFALLLKLALLGSIFISVFALALQSKSADFFFILRDPLAAARAFVALYLVVPIVAIALALAFDLPPAVKIGLVALSFSPIAPVLPKKQMKAGGRADYVAGLLFFAAVASILVAPIGVWLATQFFAADAHIGPLQILPTILLTIVIPMVLGLGARRLFGSHSTGIGSVLSAVGGIILPVCILAVAVRNGSEMLSLIGDGTLIASAAMTAAGIVAGYLLAGPNERDRAALSLSTMRHPGVAAGIAAANFPEEHGAIAAILLYLVVSIVLSLPLMGKFARLRGSPDGDVE